MSTESTGARAPRSFTDLVSVPGASRIAAGVGQQAAARANVDIRYVGAEDEVARSAARSAATESYPYSSFERGGVRRFEHSPFTRGLFEGSGELPPFRVF